MDEREHNPYERPLPTASGPTKTVVLGCAGALGLGVLLALCAAIVGWGSFVEFGIGTDFADFAEFVEASDLDPEQRDELAARMRRLRTAATDGRLDVEFVRWLDYDTEIRRLIDDGRIPDAEMLELEALIAELEAVVEPE